MGSPRPINPADARKKMALVWQKTKVDADGCYLWTASTAGQNAHKYGVISINGRNVLVHRLAWVAHTGTDIAPGDRLVHTCGKPLCVLVSHMRILPYKGGGRSVFHTLPEAANYIDESVETLLRWKEISLLQTRENEFGQTVVRRRNLLRAKRLVDAARAERADRIANGGAA